MQQNYSYANNINIDTNTAPTENLNIHTYTLDNGLKLVIKVDHKSPSAIHMVWYKVGSIDELPHKTGLSHILEHLMFKGTKRYPDFSKTMASLGARENAFTSSNYTVYHQQLPAENIRQAIFMEADRMRNLDMHSAKFKQTFSKELQVIQEERRLRTDNQPDGKLYEQLLATAYMVNATRIPTIGWMNDIQNTHVEDIAYWYGKYYQPAQATVVVVGDIVPEQIYAWAKQAYGVYSKNNVPTITKTKIKNTINNNIANIFKASPQQEPEQNGMRYIELGSKQLQDPLIYMLYKTPSYTEQPKHHLALVLLSTLLTGYDYAYLDKTLVKQDKLFSSISTSQSLIQRSLPHFFVHAKPYQQSIVSKIDSKLSNNGINTSNAIQTYTEAANIIHDKIIHAGKYFTDKDLERAKKQWLAQHIYKKDALFDTAMELGVSYTLGYAHNIFDELQTNILSISLSDIQKAIDLY
jgi:zinc protease